MPSSSSPSRKPPRRAPAPEDRQRDAQRTRAALLSAAFEEFAARGFAGARVADIAERAGVDKQLISYYFDSKDGLYREVLRTQMAEEAALNDPALPLAEVAARYVRHGLEDPRMTRLLAWAGLSGPVESSASLTDSLNIAGMRRRQAAGELPADVDPAAALLIIIGAVTAAVALPQVAEAIFGLPADSPEFADRYAAGVRGIIAHLAP